MCVCVCACARVRMCVCVCMCVCVVIVIVVVAFSGRPCSPLALSPHLPLHITSAHSSLPIRNGTAGKAKNIHTDFHQRLFIFSSPDGEKTEFMEAFPGGSDAPRRRGRTSSRTDIDPEVTKTACYIKHLFMVSVQCKRLFVCKTVFT